MRTTLTSLVLISLFTLRSAQAGEKLILEDVMNLKPTQQVVGMKSVDVKTEKLEEKSRDERHEYLKENPVPVIKGPHQELYMTDHHHLSRALVESDHRKIYVFIVENWSDLSIADFWERMEQEGYAYLKDKQGKRIKASELPGNVTLLQDDPFRSLAYFARKQGAYAKDPAPFSEFAWASFYRKYFTELDLERDWYGTLDKALDLSFEAEARNLPGYKGEFSCEGLF